MRANGVLFVAFSVVCLPLFASLTASNVANQRQCLLYDGGKTARITLSSPPLSQNPATPPLHRNLREKNKKQTKSSKKAFKSRLVLDYETKVEKMHLIKRALKNLTPNDLNPIFLDETVIVVNKPSGVLCVPDINQNPSLLDLVYKAYGDQQVIEDASNMIVNRLDMDTSGLVIFGRTPDATQQLNQAFRDRAIVKEYHALLCGHLAVDQGLIDLPLHRDPENPPFMRVATLESEAKSTKLLEDLRQAGYKKQGRKKTKPSQTQFSVLERCYLEGDENLPVTRVQLFPKTGRTHQLRVHCAALGHPIVGDATYGISGSAAKMGGLETVGRPWQAVSTDVQLDIASSHAPNEKPMCLHARMLCLTHPITNERVEWRAPVPF